MLDNIEVIQWLHTSDIMQLGSLWKRADQVRKENVGDEVHFRGLLEISNHCCRNCSYCGISALRHDIFRYRMSMEEILECVKQAKKFNYGTIVMQAGEDYGLTQDFIANIICHIKQETSLAVTLSLGERPYADLLAWKRAGADRYLLRFETSDTELYKMIHPALPTTGLKRDRFVILRELKELGYEVGSGVMIGIPGQSYESLAQDIQIFAKLDLDMIGVGPYLPDPKTPLGKQFSLKKQDVIAMQDTNIDLSQQTQVPNSELMTYKVIALARLMCPDANIPSTTALATLNKTQGRELGLMRGANVVMPNITPTRYRVHYTIYPNKACLADNAEACHQCMLKRIELVNRKVGQKQGGRRKLV